MKIPRIVAAATWLCAAANSQQIVTIPSGYANTDAPSRTVVVRNVTVRTQVVIDSWRVPIAPQDTIAALHLRRDGALAETLAGGTWSLVVRMGSATRIAADALPDYAGNSSNLLEIFRGLVSTPASPQPSGSISWNASDSIRIPLSPTLAYGGGGLVIDIESTPLGSDWWPVDAHDEAIAGAAVSVGSPCGNFSNWPATSHVDDHDLVIGRTARFRLKGEPGAAAWLMLGTDLLAVPASLSMLGSPDCALHLIPFAMLGTTVGPALVRAEFGGNAWVDVHLPADPALLSARLGAQWLEWQSTGFASSNALDVTLAAIAPTSGFAVVSGQVGSSPTVQSLGVPVIGLEIR
ncbi:MAG: hypothetical protein AB7I09_20865 [Planctomycetota bacterium]